MEQLPSRKFQNPEVEALASHSTDLATDKFLAPTSYTEQSPSGASRRQGDGSARGPRAPLNSAA